MKIHKIFTLDIEIINWLDDNKEINHSKLINNLLKRHIKELEQAGKTKCASVV